MTDNQNNNSPGKRSPLKYFLLVYAFSIPFWIIGTMVKVKGLPLNIPITDIFATLAPLAAACILVYKEEGRIGIHKLFKRILDFSRIKKKIWYLPVTFLPFLIYSLIFLIIHFLGLPIPNKPEFHFMPIFLLFALFFIAAAIEETGYMGYAIDPLQRRFGALSAGLIIGIPWAVWHYASIIQQGHDLTWIAWATLGTVAVRVLIVWIYNNTGNSLFACILFHTMLNLGRPLFPTDAIHNPLVDYPEIHYSIFAFAAVIVIILWGSRTLARYRYTFQK